MTVNEVLEILGEPEKNRKVYSGELELLYQNTIFRFIDTRLVECTLPDPGPVIIGEIPVINLFEWLSGFGRRSGPRAVPSLPEYRHRL